MSSMMPPDMEGLMGAGGFPPPPDDGALGGMPPDIAALLGGGGGEMGGMAPPEEEMLPSVADGAPGGGEEALIQAIDLIQEAIDAEADQEDIQVMMQCQTKLQAVLAKNQAEADKSMQGNLSPRAARKMAGSL